MARNTIDNMAWHYDMQVRDIASEIDDRSAEEIAEGIMEVHHQYDREFEEPKKTEKLTKAEAIDASILASQIFDWANYGTSYNDYSDPPWEREPWAKVTKKKKKKAPKKKAAKKTAQKSKNPDYEEFTVSELDAMETLSSGHMHNLKHDDGELRYWLSRMSAEDGEMYAIYVEELQPGPISERHDRGLRWVDVHQYGEPQRYEAMFKNPGTPDKATRQLKNKLLR